MVEERKKFFASLYAPQERETGLPREHKQLGAQVSGLHKIPTDPSKLFNNHGPSSSLNFARAWLLKIRLPKLIIVYEIHPFNWIGEFFLIFFPCQ